MVTGVYFAHMSLTGTGPGTEYHDEVVTLPAAATVVVTTAVTGMAAGVAGGTVGGASCYLIDYWVPGPNGGLTQVPLPGDPIDNARLITGCVRVTFRLAVRQCAAYAQGTVLVLG